MLEGRRHGEPRRRQRRRELLRLAEWEVPVVGSSHELDRCLDLELPPQRREQCHELVYAGRQRQETIVEARRIAVREHVLGDRSSIASQPSVETGRERGEGITLLPARGQPSEQPLAVGAGRQRGRQRACDDTPEERDGAMHGTSCPSRS